MDIRLGEMRPFASFGQTVYIDSNNNASLDTGELKTVTGVWGVYFFRNVAPGSYTVRLQLKNGKVLTTPKSGYLSVLVKEGRS